MPDSELSRRELARSLIAGTGAALLANSSGGDDDSPAPDAETGPGLSAVDLQLAWLRLRYPCDHLTDDQIEAIRRDIRRRQIQSGILRGHAVDDTEAPALIFAAYRSDP